MQQFAQIALLIVALITGIVLVRSTNTPPDALEPDEQTTTTVQSAAEKMLGMVETHIADQEDVKDVRCWSSVNKIQTFLSGLPVELEANSQRVERYVQMIEEIWIDSKSLSTSDDVDADVLIRVLKSRFPENVSVVEGKPKFDFGRELASLAIIEDAIKDYSDTIESWRLLQSWALRKASQPAEPETTKHAFTAEALEQFRNFLVVFDVGLLKASKGVAMDRKFSSIDAATIDIAFDQLQSIGGQ